MARCKVNYKINDEHFETLGILKDNKLTFMENDIKFSLTFNNDSIIIIRENSEYKLKLTLGSTSNCTYNLKNTNIGTLNIEVVNKLLEIKEGLIKSKYKLDDLLFNLYLTYEVI